MSLTGQDNKGDMVPSCAVVFTSSPGQFDCSDKEIETLASYGFTFSTMHMKDRCTKVVYFVRCPKRVGNLPEDFISAIGDNYQFDSD